MKRTIAAALTTGLVSISLFGCGETKTTSAKEETKINTPDGATKITTEKKIETTDDATADATP